MEGLLYVLWFVALVALFIWSRKRAARRSQNRQRERTELKTLAESRGWTYQRSVPRLIAEFSGAGPLPDAKRTPGSNVITGTHRGIPFRVFEHQRSSGPPTSGPEDVRRDGTRYQSVWAMKLDGPVPELRILNRQWRSRLTSGRPIKTGNPRLDEDFHIVTEDESGARPLLQGELGHFLLTDPRAGELPLEVRYGHLITWRSNEKLAAESLDPPLDFLADAVGRLPAQSA